MIMCDPPEGWKFGFPRVIEEEERHCDDCFTEYLRKHNYPNSHISLAIKYSRFWEVEEDA